MEDTFYGWYFSDETECLRYGDGRKIEVGVTHTVDCKPELCEIGLHASRYVLWALSYAPGPILWRVSLGGTIVHDDDKSCATVRTYHARLDATDVLRVFARQCALGVIDLWEAPSIVREYLVTGDDALRNAAREAAWDAAWTASSGTALAVASDAARDSAWAAAMAVASDAAGHAASDAAWDAAWAAAWAARDATGHAARDAAWNAAWAAASETARDSAWAAAMAVASDAAGHAASDAAWAAKRDTLEKMITDAMGHGG